MASAPLATGSRLGKDDDLFVWISHQTPVPALQQRGRRGRDDDSFGAAGFVLERHGKNRADEVCPCRSNMDPYMKAVRNVSMSTFSGSEWSQHFLLAVPEVVGVFPFLQAFGRALPIPQMRLATGRPHGEALVDNQLVVVDQHAEVAAQLGMGAGGCGWAAQGLEVEQHHHIQQVVPEDIKAAADVPAQITNAVFRAIGSNVSQSGYSSNGLTHSSYGPPSISLIGVPCRNRSRQE